MPTYRGRPDLDRFERGAIYVHAPTKELVRFEGVASMPELDGEDVGVFNLIDARGEYLIATQRGYDSGDVFTPAGELIEEEFRDEKD
jgi:hypothetical protein